MRRFAADVISGLRLSPTEAPRPWVLPSRAQRVERDRLTHLLIQGLRRFDPELQVMQLRWIERRVLSGGRLPLPENTLIWWRVQADGDAPRDARALAREAEALHVGLHLLDIEGPIVNERLGWLGPLKLATYYGVIDALHEPRPWPKAEALAGVLNELVTLVVSPLDLLDLAEALIDKSTNGMNPDEARAWALGHHIAARLNPLSAEDCVGCLAAVTEHFGGRPLGGEARALWVRAGLLDPDAEDTLPIVGTLAEPEVARVAVTQLTLRQHPGRPLKELVPAELLPLERFELPHFDLAGLMNEVSGATMVPWLASLSLQEVTPRLSEEEARPIEARLLRALREGRPPSQEDAERAKDVVDVILARVHPHKLSPEETSAELRRAAELAEVMVKDREQRARALLKTVNEALEAGDVERAKSAFDEANDIYGGDWPQALNETAMSTKATILFYLKRFVEAIQAADALKAIPQNSLPQALLWLMMRIITLFSLIQLDRRVEAVDLVRGIVKVSGESNYQESAVAVAQVVAGAVVAVGHLMRVERADEWASLLEEAEKATKYEPVAQLLIRTEKTLLRFDQSQQSVPVDEIERIWSLRQQLKSRQAARVGACLLEHFTKANDYPRVLELLDTMLDPAENIDFGETHKKFIDLRNRILAHLESQAPAPE